MSELIPDDVLEEYGAKAAKAAYAKIPIATVVKGSLIGKIGSVFASTATLHGGQETTVATALA